MKNVGDREIEEKVSEEKEIIESREVRGKLPCFLCQGNTGEEKKMYVVVDARISFASESLLINSQERNFFATTAEAIFFFFFGKSHKNLLHHIERRKTIECLLVGEGLGFFVFFVFL